MFNSFFNQNQDLSHTAEADTTHKKIGIETSLGRSITALDSASETLNKPLKEFNPLEFIDNDSLYYGLDYLSQKEIVKLEKSEVTHSLIVGPTRCGKGVLISAKIVESLRNGRGVVVVDPKQDNFLPQVILEELKRQNREEDLLICNFPNDYSYSGFESTDTVADIVNKLVSLLELEDDPNNSGASFYRRNQRTILQKIIFFFFKSYQELNVKFEITFKDLINFIFYVFSDLQNEVLYQKEIQKFKANSELIDKFSVRYFDPKKFEKFNFIEKDLDTLQNLYQTLLEFKDINIYSKNSIKKALFEGKVLYIKSDMLDNRAMKLLKMMINDIIIQARKFSGAKCDVYLDELSFYPSTTLSSALATIAGFGVNFTLAYQDDSQLTNINLKNAIKSNCQLKIYYKSSDLETLNFIEKLSGNEIITKISKKDEDLTIKQELEPYINITKLRVLPRSFVAVLISESLTKPIFIQSYFIKTENEFNWNFYNSISTKIEATELTQKHSIFEENQEKKGEKVDEIKEDLEEILEDDEDLEEDDF